MGPHFGRRLDTPESAYHGRPGICPDHITGNVAIEPGERPCSEFSSTSARSAPPAIWARPRRSGCARERTRSPATSPEVGDRIRFADPVRAITQDADGVTVKSDAGTLRCRRVAVCVPPPLASQITYTPALPDARARLLGRLPMGASVKFHAVYPRPFWRAQGLSGQVWTGGETVSLTYDNSPDDGTGRGALVGLVVADEARRLGGLDTEGQEQEILTSLNRFFGPDAAAPDMLVVQDWGAEEWTGGCYAAHFPPNVWTTYGSAFRAPCGRIHWAGRDRKRMARLHGGRAALGSPRR